jgi:plasmid stabilization system protein ParE
LAPQVEADLQAIYDYISSASAEHARRMVKRLLDGIEKLCEFPHRTVLQHQNRKLNHPVRSLPIRPYIVYFRVIDQEQIVRVLTIRHGARRRPRSFP